MKAKFCLHVVLGVAACALAGLAWIVLSRLYHQWHLDDQFGGSQSLISLVARCKGALRNSGRTQEYYRISQCPIQPKLLILSEQGMRVSVSPVQEMLPPFLRASQLSEVHTVLVVRCSYEAAGQYSNGGLAEREMCSLAAVELPNTVLFEAKIEEGPPFQIWRRAGDQRGASGRVSESTVLEYIRHLPGCFWVELPSQSTSPRNPCRSIVERNCK
jgi:hypothetical protein